jgi:hypothetical protein
MRPTTDGGAGVAWQMRVKTNMKLADIPDSSLKV